MSKLFVPALLLAAAGSSACQYHARSPEEYQAVTRAVLDTRSAQIKSCYDEALKTDKNVGGMVVVHFTVVEETGAITGAEVTKDSTAPEALGQCVVQALDGLAIDPPDERQGDATFVWEFKSAG